MLNGVVQVEEDLGPAIACYQSDSLEVKEELIFSVPFCKMNFFSGGRQIASFPHTICLQHPRCRCDMPTTVRCFLAT